MITEDVLLVRALRCVLVGAARVRAYVDLSWKRRDLLIFVNRQIVPVETRPVHSLVFAVGLGTWAPNDFEFRDIRAVVSFEMTAQSACVLHARVPLRTARYWAEHTKAECLGCDSGAGNTLRGAHGC